MLAIDRDSVLAALATVKDPDLGRDLVSLEMIRDLEIEGDRLSLRVVLTTPACPLKERIRSDVVAALAAIGVHDPAITMDAEVRKAPRVAGPGGGPRPERLPGVKAVVCVASGKGGVGKSTVATNLAVALARSGARVGLLDADIYGPSMPVMLGLRKTRPAMTPQGKIAPIERYGLLVMSMGFMLKDEQAVVWRGPMLGKALEQFIDDVDWGELDYLVLDLPPGTGDVQLSLAQLLPVTGAVVVTTPQDVAFADVRRAIRMLGMTQVPVLGLVENMSHFVCTTCGTEHRLFGESRIAAQAGEQGLEVLGSLPLDTVTAIAADRGEPIVVAAPDGEAAKRYLALAGRVSQKIAVMTAEAPAEDRFKAFFAMQQPSG
jgi:ATP-binding protein involved in chromosome partitioning